MEEIQINRGDSIKMQNYDATDEGGYSNYGSADKRSVKLEIDGPIADDYSFHFKENFQLIAAAENSE